MGGYWSSKKKEKEEESLEVTKKTSQWQVVRGNRTVAIGDLPSDVQSMFVLRKTRSPPFTVYSVILVLLQA